MSTEIKNLSIEATEVHGLQKTESSIPTEDQLINLLFYGDIASLSVKQRAEYLWMLAKKLGLDPASKPFDIIPIQGGTKLVVYANKGAAAQLAVKYKLNVQEVGSGFVPGLDNIYFVKVKITGFDESGNNRETFNVGTVSTLNLKGDSLANKVMSCHTKAIRRAILMHCGLGFPDESEVDSIKDETPFKTFPAPSPSLVPAEVPLYFVDTVVGKEHVVTSPYGKPSKPPMLLVDDPEVASNPLQSPVKKKLSPAKLEKKENT